MSDVEERGFAVIAGAVMIALALFMGFGAAVVVAQSNLIHSAKIAQELIATRAHEELYLIPDLLNNEILIVNKGSTPSIVVKLLLVKEPGGVLEAIDQDVYIGILDNGVISILDLDIEEGDNVGALTRLGNVFWKEVCD